MAITEEKTVEEKNLSFVEQLVEQDLAEGKNAGRIQTRFPCLLSSQPASPRPGLGQLPSRIKTERNSRLLNDLWGHLQTSVA